MYRIVDEPPFRRKTLWERYINEVVDPVNGPYTYTSPQRNADGFEQVHISLFWQETTAPYAPGNEATLGVEFGWNGTTFPIRKEMPIARELGAPRFEGNFDENYEWSWFIDVPGPQFRITFDWNFNGTGILRLRANMLP
jgi:hypothetical protein